MKSKLLIALSLAAPIILAGCNTASTNARPSIIEKQLYAGCATDPPTDPSCGHH
jgi:uncharacterized lipoprotein NlpE involved in copper resistance